METLTFLNIEIMLNIKNDNLHTQNTNPAMYTTSKVFYNLLFM